MLRDAGHMEAACKQLLEAGLIREHFTRAGEGKGRKALNYKVHPEVADIRPFADSPASDRCYRAVPKVPLASIAPISTQTAPKAQTAQGGKKISDAESTGSTEVLP